MLERTRLSIVFILVAASMFVVPSGAAAQTVCPGGNEGSPNRIVDWSTDGWDINAAGTHLCGGGLHLSVYAVRMTPGDLVPAGRINRPLGPVGFTELPIYCRRDDYAFLPPNALGGIPCVSVPNHDEISPHDLAFSLEMSLPPPDLRIGMNPKIGLVAVPTWFWVEGYDGGDLRTAETVLQQWVEEHFEVARDASGHPVLDPDGRPHLNRITSVRTATMSVEVRMWPTHYNWDFGDRNAQDITCKTPTACDSALGQMFIDAHHPSTIQHPYNWTSLGKIGTQGEQDTYKVDLGITFSAAFRVGFNGTNLGGWQALPERQLSWTTNHQVREAQAVLVRP